LLLAASVEKRVIECFFVPYAISVEDKHFLALAAPEDHGAIEHEDVPKQIAAHVAVVDLLQRVDVHEVLLHPAEEFHFVEHHLLRMRQQFCVESEIMDAVDGSWQLCCRNKGEKSADLVIPHQ